jgi:hypothetical protein
MSRAIEAAANSVAWRMEARRMHEGPTLCDCSLTLPLQASESGDTQSRDTGSNLG